MTDAPPLRSTLKRGALIAAANWPLVVVQFVAEATLKLLLAVPVVGRMSWSCSCSRRTSTSCSPATSGRSWPRFSPRCARIPRAHRVQHLVRHRRHWRIRPDVRDQGRHRRASGAEPKAQAGPIERPPLRVAAIRRAGCRHNRRRISTAPAPLAPIRATLGMCLAGRLRADGARLYGADRERLPAGGQHRLALQLDLGAAIGSSVLIVWISI